MKPIDGHLEKTTQKASEIGLECRQYVSFVNLLALAQLLAHLVSFFLFSPGSDLFMDNLVHNYLKTLFHFYTHSSQLASLDFNRPIPGISSFYDL